MREYTMGPKEKYAAFLGQIKSATSKFTKRRSSLRGLCEYMEGQIDDYLRRGKPIEPFRSIDDAKSKCRIQHDPRLIKYDPALRRLVECWGRAANFRYTSNAMPLIRAVQDELNACKGFACADAKTFEMCIRPGMKKRILSLANERNQLFTAPPNIPIGGMQAMKAGATTAWNPAKLKSAHKSVYEKKVGECTNFGYAAGHTLMKGCEDNNLDFRVEVVSWRGLNRKKTAVVTHLFCVLNRDGGSVKEVIPGRGEIQMRRLPHFSTWGIECVIVDTWLASLGWHNVFTVQNYPFLGMLDPVYQEMDSLVTLDDPFPWRSPEYQ